MSGSNTQWVQGAKPTARPTGGTVTVQLHAWTTTLVGPLALQTQPGPGAPPTGPGTGGTTAWTPGQAGAQGAPRVGTTPRVPQPTQPPPTPPVPPEQTAFLDRFGKLAERLTRLSAAVGTLAAPPAAVTGALKTANDAKPVAEKAGQGEVADWTVAGAALDSFEAQIDAVGAACLAQARILATDFTRRYVVTDAKRPSSAGIAAAYKDYGEQKTSLDGLIAAGDGVAALAACPAAEAALAALEVAASPTPQKRVQTVAAALVTFKGLEADPAELAKMPLAEKAELALDLCANGTPQDNEPDPRYRNANRPIAGGTLDALCKLYIASPPDRDFLDARQKQMDDIAVAVAALPEIDALFDETGEPNAAAWSAFAQDSGKVKALMEKVGKAQTDAIGMGAIAINKKPDPPKGRSPSGGLTFGGYEPNTNQINLNLHKDCLPDLREALVTVIHETFHAHQDVLVKKLKAGEIGPADPLYGTAMMCLVNDTGVGYVPSGLGGQGNYEVQPTELDAEGQSQIAASLALSAIKKMKLANKAKSGIGS